MSVIRCRHALDPAALVVVLACSVVRADSTVVFNEVMYHPATNEAQLEWIELHNQMAVDMDISNWALADGVQFRFPEGTIVSGGGFLVVAISPAALERETGFAGALGPFAGRLDNGGERLELRDNNNRLMDSVSYRDRGTWPVAPDGSGVSLAKIEPGSASRPAANWTASTELGGTPGEHNFSAAELAGIPEGVVSYWSFDEGEGDSVVDAYGQNIGRLGNAATRVAGLVGDGAISFDNSRDAFIDVGAGSNDNFSTSTGITVEALVKPEWSGDAADEDHIFRKQDGTRRIVLAFQHDGEADDRDVPIDPAEQPVLSFGLNIGGSYSELDMPLDGREGRPTLAQLKDGAAHHIAATYDSASGVKAIFIDGTLAFSAGFEEGSLIGSGGRATAYIGNMAGRGHPFTGVIDEVAFWDRALSAAEVAAHASKAREGKSYFEEDDDTEPTTDRPALAFNETSVSAAESWVELVNHGSRAIPLGGFVIVSSGGMASELVLPEQVLEAGAHLTLSPQELGFDLAAEDKLFLFDPDRTAVIDAVVLDEEPRARHPEGTGEWLSPDRPTPGAANSFTFHDEIVINEIMYQHRPTLEQPAVIENIVVFPVESEWRFDQSGEDLGTAWREVGFDDGAWASGRALFFNETSTLPAEKNTPIELGPLTYYFRTEFTFDGDPAAVDLALRPVVDDGAVFYLNGAEVLRTRMPEGDIDATTRASRSVGNARFEGPFSIPTEHLKVGTNVLAAEVHQVNDSSNDVVFGVEIVEVRTVSEASEYEESPEEWVELYNRSDREIDLTGWRFNNGIRYAFEDGTRMAPGAYLVVASDVDALRAKYPGIAVAGNFEGRVSNRTDRLALVDDRGNPVDEVRYHDRGRWPSYADGLGSSLELRDPRADNSRAEAWDASDETAKSAWQTYTYADVARPDFGPSQWNELVFGLFEDGEMLLDDLSVIDLTSGEEMLQNGDFEAGDATWRFLGTHDRTRVIADPDDPANQVLHLVATGPTEHMHNHVETTYVRGQRVTNGREYSISFRARWLAGSNQLHTRLYFNRLARTNVIAVPYDNGTPGARNSVFEENIGPTYSGFGHAPVFPAPGQDVVVTVAADDSDGVRSCRVRWSDDREMWQSAAMALGEDGLWRGVIPWQGNTIIAFYVEGEDTRGATSTFPAGGPDGRALFTALDGEAPLGRVHTLRIIMAPDVARFLYENTNRMSNDRLPATVVLDESRVFYDVSVRLRGSERGRPDESRTGFNIAFQPDELFRGVHQTVSLDRSGGWASFISWGAQDEICIKHIANHAGGIPSMYDDIGHVIAPRRQHTGRALFMMGRFSSVYLDSQYENGSDGTKYTYELIYHPTTTVNGNPESLKRPLPDSVIGVDHRNLGPDKELYRWFYLIENNIQRDDYSNLMRFTSAVGRSGAALDAASREAMDVDQFLRAFAMYSLCGVGDTYMSGNLHNNIYWVRPSDGRVLVFPWDMDFAFVNSPSHPVIWTQHNLRNLFQLPANTRAYYRHALDIMDTTFNADYMRRWVEHYGELDGVNFSGILGYITQRERFVRTDIGRRAPQVPFAITTNDGEDFTVEETSARIEGTAWLDVATLIVQERPEAEVAWSSVTRWRITVDLEPGANPLTVLAFDAEGSLIDAREITVTSAVEPPGPPFIRGDANADGRVNITDAVGVLNHIFRGMPAACESAADVNDDNTVNITDAITLLDFLFLQGPPPGEPFPEPGRDIDTTLACEKGLEEA